MNEVFSGLCYPLFIYLIVSLSGILGILLQGGKNSGLISFFIFIIICFSTLLINMLCSHDWASAAWISTIISTGTTLFIVNDSRFGNVNIMSYVASVESNIIDYSKKVYNAFQHITAK